MFDALMPGVEECCQNLHATFECNFEINQKTQLFNSDEHFSIKYFNGITLVKEMFAKMLRSLWAQQVCMG